MLRSNLPPLILRLGLGLVLLWFGTQQLGNAATWVKLLPTWSAALPLAGTTLIQLNGWLELVLAALLWVGFYTPLVAGLLALHLASITSTLGYNAVGVRDFGLTLAALALSVSGAGRWSLDSWFVAKKKSPDAVVGA